MTTTSNAIKIETPTSLRSSTVSMVSISKLIQTAAAYLATNSKGIGSTGARSVELAGFAKNIFPESCGTTFSSETVQHFDDFIDRRSELAVNPSSVGEIKWDTANPNLLVVNWKDSLFDGACSPITNGFLDDDCMPGWDTWLAIVSLDDKSETVGLLCWIPCELESAVDSAISIDAASCMSWVSENSGGEFFLHGWGQSRE